MRFRPCIDIHDGRVKQIVGGSLFDNDKNILKENFVSTQDASFYANLYKNNNLSGGHIIILNKKDTKEYEMSIRQAKLALSTYKDNLQIGGGIDDTNAKMFLDMGASHVIVTSFVFKNGEINYDNLEKLKNIVGKKNLVLDLSCRKKDDNYYIVTDRWQNYTAEILSEELIEKLKKYCDEFLIHAVDVEGKARGIEKDVVRILSKVDGFPITYAGGIASFEDLNELKTIGKEKLDFTVGSALDIFGGKMEFDKVVKFI